MKLSHSFLTLASISIAALSLNGCGGESTSSSDVCGGCDDKHFCNEQTKECEAIECNKDEDCDGDLICKNYKCAVECTNNDDCEGSLICKNDRCVPECSTNDDCKGALICENNQCVPECETNADCNANANEICHNGECLEKCLEDSDCASGMMCYQDACVDCKTASDCKDNVNGTFCVSNHCVACENDKDCPGTMVCNNSYTCEPMCKSNNNCTDRDNKLPYCLNADDDEASVCVQCIEAGNCLQDQFCENNVCKYECEQDINCNDSKKCDLSDHHCYECIYSVDCGSNLICDRHTCVACAYDDADCDGVLNDVDACPYNPYIDKLKVEGETEECNYVTDENGKKYFEVWSAADFKRLAEEIVKFNSPETGELCQTPVDEEHPTVGECCDNALYQISCDSESGKALSCIDGKVVETDCDYGCYGDSCALCSIPAEGQSSYVAGNCCSDSSFTTVCQNGKLLSCFNNIVVEEPCPYGCSGNTCAWCIEREANAEYVAGNCCYNSFEPVCSNNKALSCVNGVVVEEACTYGCGDTSCNLCTTPTGDELVDGNCCDSSSFGQVCTKDKNASLECIDGVIHKVPCDKPCAALGENQVICSVMPKPEFRVRLMKDINIADALSDGDIQDVEFEKLKVVWRETVTDEETGETSTVIHEPSDSDSYTITDDTCVGRWAKDTPIALKNVDFDGQGHRIFFKAEDGRSCSMVDSLFADIDDSHVHDFSIQYNVRGLVSSTFADNIRNSAIENIQIKGNINLETRPALDEIDVNSYIQNDSLKNFDPYHYSIISINRAENSLFNGIQFVGNVTANFTLNNNSCSNKLIPGLSGLFGYLDHCTVQNTSVTVPDYVYTYGRTIVPFAWTITNSTSILNPVINIPYISGRSERSSLASSFVSGLGYDISNTTFGGDIDITLGDVSTPGSFYYGLGWHFNSTKVLGDVHIQTGNIKTNSNFYNIADYCQKTEFQGIDTKLGDLEVGTRYFGIAYDLPNTTIHNDIHLQTGSIYAGDEFDGVAEKFTGTVGGNIDIEIADQLTSRHYYGLARTLELTLNGNITIKLPDLNLGSNNYYGIAGTSNKSSLNDVSITVGNLNYHNYFGLFDNPNNSNVLGTTTIVTGNHTSDDTYIGLAYARNPVSFGDVSITTGNMENRIYYYGLGQEISPNAITLTGTTNIEAGDMTNMGWFYGLARDIKGNCSNVNLRFGNISQINRTVEDFTWYFAGLAGGAFSTEDALISNINLEIGNITSPFYIAPLFFHCLYINRNNNNVDYPTIPADANRPENKLKIDNIMVTVGNMELGFPNSSKYGDFDGLCRYTETTMSHIDAKYGNIFIRENYRGMAMTSTLYPKGQIKDTKVEVDSIISEDYGPVGMIMELKGSIENVVVVIHHLQNRMQQHSVATYTFNSISAITKTFANASIKNVVYYADDYTIVPNNNVIPFFLEDELKRGGAGFIQTIGDKSLTLENVFSTARLNRATGVNASTHRAVNTSINYLSPLLFKNVPSDAIEHNDDLNQDKLALNPMPKNVFWLKRNDSVFATDKSYVAEFDGDIQFKDRLPNGTKYVLETQGSSYVDLEETFSGCAYINASCTTPNMPWQDTDHMKTITEPGSNNFAIPWLKECHLSANNEPECRQ